MLGLLFRPFIGLTYKRSIAQNVPLSSLSVRGKRMPRTVVILRKVVGVDEGGLHVFLDYKGKWRNGRQVPGCKCIYNAYMVYFSL